MAKLPTLGAVLLRVRVQVSMGDPCKRGLRLGRADWEFSLRLGYFP